MCIRDRVWTVNVQDLSIIGRLFNEGRVDMTKIIAVAGSEIEKPQYCRVVAEMCIRDSFNKTPRNLHSGVFFVRGDVSG